MNLCRFVLGGQTVKNVRRLAYEFELDQSQRKWVAKRNASWTQIENLRQLTCVYLRVRLARDWVLSLSQSLSQQEESSWPRKVRNYILSAYNPAQYLFFNQKPSVFSMRDAGNNESPDPDTAQETKHLLQFHDLFAGHTA